MTIQSSHASLSMFQSLFMLFGFDSFNCSSLLCRSVHSWSHIFLSMSLYCKNESHWEPCKPILISSAIWQIKGELMMCHNYHINLFFNKSVGREPQLSSCFKVKRFDIQSCGCTHNQYSDIAAQVHLFLRETAEFIVEKNKSFKLKWNMNAD